MNFPSTLISFGADGSLQKGRLPVNIGMTEQDKECKVNIVTQAKAHPEKLEYALSKP